MVAMRAAVNTLYRISQLVYLVAQLAHLALQGLSDVGAELRDVILTQIHFLLAVVSLQALYLVLVLAATHKPAAAAKQRHRAQDDFCYVHFFLLSFCSLAAWLFLTELFHTESTESTEIFACRSASFFRDFRDFCVTFK